MNKHAANISLFYEQPSYREIVGIPQNKEIHFKELYYMPRNVASLPGAMAPTMLHSFTQTSNTHSALYLHIPFCSLRCSYCSFYRNSYDAEQVDQYVKALVAELELLKKQEVFEHTTMDAVFFGGGTPSVLTPQQITTLLDKIHASVKLAPDCELTFESSIYDLTLDKIDACIKGGINRFSFGVQAFDTGLRRSLGRLNTEEDVLRLLKTVSQTDARVIIDLIYGLPGQTKAMLLSDIDKAMDCGISGMDLYKLQIMPKSPLEQAIEKGKIHYEHSQRDLLEVFLAADAKLHEKGASQLSCCHWAFKQDERSRYNTMVKSGANIIACGISCGGRMGPYKHMKLVDKEAYKAALEQEKYPVMAMGRQNEAYELLERLTGQCDCGILNLMELPNYEEADWNGLLAPILRHWTDIELLTVQGNKYIFTPKGKFYYRQMERILLNAAEYALYGPPDAADQAAPKMMGAMKNMK